MKCLFLGYSRLQKGYRCYSLETHRYFISADVTFFEDSPFFSTTSESLPVSEVLPIPIVSPPDAMPPRPLQVYHRRPRVVAPLPFPEAPADSLPIPSASPAPALPSPNDLPIAVRKGWRQAMVDEMAALHSNGTWDLVVLPSGKSTVGCRWVYAVKVGPDGQVDRLKARLVAKGYTQVYGSDYGDTFSPVAKIASVRLLLSMAAMCSWPLYQLDIKNAFLHGDLAEEVYMEQPPGFVAQGESGLVCRLRRSLYGLKQSPRAWFSRFSSVVQEFGMLRSTADHSVFYHHNSLGQCIYLVVYVDDIVITGSDQDGIQKLKQHLFTHFQTKDLGKLKYFLGIEIAQSSSGVVLSQRKYALDILEETGMLDCKPVDTPMDPNVKLVPGQGEPLGDPRRYRRLSPCDSHWDAVIRILRYIKSTPGQGVLYENRGHTQVVGYTDADWAGSPTDRRSTSGYCVFIGGNLISWKSKKQDVVARSSAEAEYRAMTLATCELIWLRHLLQELRFGKDEQMKLICDNQAALHIASNPVFHERTKHIEVDCHFIREKIASGCVATSFVNSNDQLADIFTKSLRGPRIKYICNKLGAYDILDPLRAMVTGAPLEDARHLAQRYSRMRHEAETQAAEVSRRQARLREAPNPENAARLNIAEAKMKELKANMAVLGKEAAAALAAVEAQQQRLSFQRLVAMVEGERTYHQRIATIFGEVESEMVSEKQRKESAPPAIPSESHSEKTMYFLAEVGACVVVFREVILLFTMTIRNLGLLWSRDGLEGHNKMLLFVESCWPFSVFCNGIKEPKHVLQAMHAFSAASEKELSLNVGDYVVVRKVSHTGWSEGECKGKAGWFPSEYVAKRQRLPTSNVAAEVY
ncbi:Retrovirus-related Pol polyprotein from transposon RE2 [Vitis vinifera]|uniref:Retrovirus-related Pol polyprotein from transposon RE2 n=1 Tax=Vitis vinifera TaxID=29760 RepID=A0A438EI99_VITVI|nr:Retrovirus-related Pol polyprotein from transposon RE2 [Vitis vinifera]